MVSSEWLGFPVPFSDRKAVREQDPCPVYCIVSRWVGFATPTGLEMTRTMIWGLSEELGGGEREREREAFNLHH